MKRKERYLKLYGRIYKTFVTSWIHLGGDKTKDKYRVNGKKRVYKDTLDQASFDEILSKEIVDY